MTAPDLDDIDRAILAALSRDGRVSWAALGRGVGLSASATADRVRRLEAAGVLRGFGARIDRAALGRPLTAFVRLRCGSERHPALRRTVAALPEVVECHHVTGGDEILLKLAAASVPALDAVLTVLAPFGPTASALVLDTWVDS